MKVASLTALTKSNKNLGMKILQLEKQLANELGEKHMLLEHIELLEKEAVKSRKYRKGVVSLTSENDALRKKVDHYRQSRNNMEHVISIVDGNFPPAYELSSSKQYDISSEKKEIADLIDLDDEPEKVVVLRNSELIPQTSGATLGGIDDGLESGSDDGAGDKHDSDSDGIVDGKELANAIKKRHSLKCSSNCSVCVLAVPRPDSKRNSAEQADLEEKLSMTKLQLSLVQIENERILFITSSAISFDFLAELRRRGDSMQRLVLPPPPYYDPNIQANLETAQLLRPAEKKRKKSGMKYLIVLGFVSVSALICLVLLFKEFGF